VVAPSNEAFAKSQSWKADNTTLVTAVLRYHVLQGTIVAANMSEGPPVFRSSLLADKAFTNVTGGQNVVVYRQAGDTVVFASGDGTRSTLLEADALFKGGSVQMVDTLMVPPARLERTARDTYPRDLSAFLGALYAAGIVADVADAADVTIFAPRNAAFQQLAGALETLPREQLMEVLRYHVVPGKVLASTALINDTELVSSLGQANGRVKITRAGNNVFVNAAQVVQPDILIANGVVHVIDNGKLSSSAVPVSQHGIGRSLTADSAQSVGAFASRPEPGDTASGLRPDGCDEHWHAGPDPLHQCAAVHGRLSRHQHPGALVDDHVQPHQHSDQFRVRGGPVYGPRRYGRRGRRPGRRRSRLSHARVSFRAADHQSVPCVFSAHDRKTGGGPTSAHR